MAVFPLLADPATYRGASVDLNTDAAERAVWLDIFEENLVSLVDRCIESEPDDPTAPQRAKSVHDTWAAKLNHIRENPAEYALSVLKLCVMRERVLRDAGFADPYSVVKQAENEKAIRVLPAVLEELDAMPPAERIEAIITGVFAGNIFDLGTVATTAMFEQGGIDFHAVRARIKPRPWLFDGLDAVRDRMMNRPWSKAVVFVDNAGADVLLGMAPLCRELLRAGTRVIATANTHPALNDILHHELVPLVERIAAFDTVIADAVADGRLTMIASGNDAPLIDLTNVSDELAAASADADLVILEGMGRSLETNFHDSFAVDALKLAMVKEPAVAAHLGGEMYDVVCKYEPAWR